MRTNQLTIKTADAMTADAIEKAIGETEAKKAAEIAAAEAEAAGESEDSADSEKTEAVENE